MSMFQCPSCRFRYQWTQDLAGRSATCDQCHKAITIPSAPTLEGPAARAGAVAVAAPTTSASPSYWKMHAKLLALLGGGLAAMTFACVTLVIITFFLVRGLRTPAEAPIALAAQTPSDPAPTVQPAQPQEARALPEPAAQTPSDPSAPIGPVALAPDTSIPLEPAPAPTKIPLAPAEPKRDPAAAEANTLPDDLFQPIAKFEPIADEIAADAPAALPGPEDDAYWTSKTQDVPTHVELLPAPMRAITVAGDARYLVGHIPTLHYLAVFDIEQGRVVRYMPIDVDNLSLAGGRSKLVVIDHDKELLQRYSLETGKRELSIQLSTILNNNPRGLVTSRGPRITLEMGDASNGPVVINQQFLDLATFNPIKLTPTRAMWGYGQSQTLYMSADGSTVIGHDQAGRIRGEALEVENPAVGRVVVANQKPLIVPGRRGPIVLIDEAGIPIGEGREYAGIVKAAYDDRYFLGVMKQTSGRDTGPAPVRIFNSSTGRSLVELPPLAEMPGMHGSYGDNTVTHSNRLHYWPSRQLLVTLGPGLDRFIVRKVALPEKIDGGQPTVLSAPPLKAKRGNPYTYQIQTEEADGPITFELLGAPSNMTITKAGLIQWLVPAKFEYNVFGVIVTLTNATGVKTFHAFTVEIE